MKTIFTVGYGNRSPRKFVELLKEHDIKVVLDVRRQDSKAWHGYYHAGSPFIKFLWEHQLIYLPAYYLGNQEDSLADYDAWLCGHEGKPQLEVLELSIKALELYGNLAIMCACKQPAACHRQIIAAHLMRSMGKDAGGEWDVKHI